jgi:hypothetical protein
MKKFLIVKNIIQKKDSNEIFDHFIKVCKHIAPEVFKKKNYSNFFDEELCTDLINHILYGKDSSAINIRCTK